jgi:predicted ester cyclase
MHGGGSTNGGSVTPKALVRAFVAAVNHRDWQTIESLVAIDFVRHSIAAGEPGVHSRQELIQFLRAEYVTFPDASEEIAEILSDGDKVAVRMRFRGTQAGSLGTYPPTNKAVHSEYLAIYRIERRLIVEAWAEWDNLASLKQLGHLQ